MFKQADVGESFSGYIFRQTYNWSRCRGMYVRLQSTDSCSAASDALESIRMVKDWIYLYSVCGPRSRFVRVWVPGNRRLKAAGRIVNVVY